MRIGDGLAWGYNTCILQPAPALCLQVPCILPYRYVLLAAMAYTSLFSDYPRAARLWIHVARHDVPRASQEAMRTDLDSFFASWDSHGQPVSADVTWRDDRFLFVTAHVAAEGAAVSGCATDALVHTVREAATAHDIAWAPALSVPYRTADGSVAVADRAAFAKLARAHTVDVTTPVFDPSLSTLGPLHDGAFEQPAGTSWHARAFSLAHPA